jgi:hypothetical protein
MKRQQYIYERFTQAGMFFSLTRTDKIRQTDGTFIEKVTFQSEPKVKLDDFRGGRIDGWYLYKYFKKNLFDGPVTFGKSQGQLTFNHVLRRTSLSFDSNGGSRPLLSSGNPFDLNENGQ